MATGATIYDKVVEFLATVSYTADTLGSAVASLQDGVMMFAGDVMTQLWNALVAAVPVRP